MKVSKQ